MRIKRRYISFAITLWKISSQCNKAESIGWIDREKEGEKHLTSHWLIMSTRLLAYFREERNSWAFCLNALVDIFCIEEAPGRSNASAILLYDRFVLNGRGQSVETFVVRKNHSFILYCHVLSNIYAKYFKIKTRLIKWRVRFYRRRKWNRDRF